MPKLIDIQLLRQMSAIRLKNYLKTLYSVKTKKAIYRYSCGYFNFSSGSPTEGQRTLIGYNLSKNDLVSLNNKIIEVRGVINNA